MGSPTPGDPAFASQLVGPKADAFLPAKRLMAAVLGVAPANYQMYADAEDVCNRRRFAAIDAWCASDEAGWPFLFVNICATLDLDVPSIRAARPSLSEQGHPAERPHFLAPRMLIDSPS